jgi:hypothetical protein
MAACGAAGIVIHAFITQLGIVSRMHVRSLPAKHLDIWDMLGWRTVRKHPRTSDPPRHIDHQIKENLLRLMITRRMCQE